MTTSLRSSMIRKGQTLARREKASNCTGIRTPTPVFAAGSLGRESIGTPLYHESVPTRLSRSISENSSSTHSGE